MPGGQQITTGTGTIQGIGGDNNFAATGTGATSATGSTGQNRLLLLRSRKASSGTASQALAGQAATGATGTLGRQKTFALTGQGLTLGQGVFSLAGQATIGWTANTEPDLAGYRVYHGTTSGVYSEFVSLGTVTLYTWVGLVTGQTHYFAVAAYDTSGNESAKSLEVSKAL